MTTRIKRISTTGFKASDRVYELGQLNFLRGSVGTGKSQVSDGVQFAGLGCVPRVGKNEAATARLMPGNEMTVAILLDDDRSFTRSLTRIGRTLKGGADASWMPRGSKPTEVSDEVRKLFGSSAELAAENLDIMRLLDRSGSDLAKTIETILDSGGVSESERINAAIKIWHQRIDSERKKVDGLLQPVDPSVARAVRAHLDEFTAQVQNSIVKAIDWAGAEKRAAANEATDQVKARSALENRLNELRAPAETEEQLKALKLESERRRTELQTQIDMVEKAARDRAAAAASVEKALEEANKARAELDALIGSDIDPEALRAEAEAIEDPSEVEPFAIATMDEDPSWSTRRDEITRLRAEADAIVIEPAPARPVLLPMPQPIETRAAWLDRHAAERALERAAGSPWVRAGGLIEKIAGDGFECQGGPLENYRPFMDLRAIAAENAEDISALEADLQAKTKVYEDLQALAEARAGEIEVLQAKNLAAEEEHALATSAWQDAENQRQNTMKALRGNATALEAALKAEVDAARASVAQANRTGMKAWEERRDAYRIQVRDNAQQRKCLCSQADEHESAIRDSRTTLRDAESTLNSAKARLDGLTDAIAVNVEAAREEIAELDSTIERTQEALVLCEQATTLSAEMQSMIDRIDRATANQAAFSAAEWALKRLRDDDMSQRSKGLESRIGRFLAAAGRKETPYMRCEKGSAEFGWSTPEGKEVAVQALSGGQAVIFRAALAYAVVCARNPEVRVLNIELAEAADGAVAEAVLRACGEICDEVQVIVASCAPVAVPSESWTVIDVAQPQEVQA